MSKKNKPISRNEPAATQVNAAPAGASTEASAPEVPSPTDTAETVTPEVSSVATTPVDAHIPADNVVSAIKQEQPRGGASFFIPAQKQSGFGAK
jgi:hypothetical protein